MKITNFAIILVFLLGVFAVNPANAQKKAAKDGKVEMTIGFHCANGKVKIEKMLSELDGVKSYTVNLETKKVEVVFDAKATNKEKIEEAFLNMGYSVDGKASKSEHKCDGHGEEGHDHDHDK
jgi:copper chaperone CopZ